MPHLCPRIRVHLWTKRKKTACNSDSESCAVDVRGLISVFKPNCLLDTAQVGLAKNAIVTGALRVDKVSDNIGAAFTTSTPIVGGNSSQSSIILKRDSSETVPHQVVGSDYPYNNFGTDLLEQVTQRPISGIANESLKDSEEESENGSVIQARLTPPPTDIDHSLTHLHPPL